MEESIWMYFGIIVVIVTLGIIASLFSSYYQESRDDLLFQGLEQLGRQTDIVCSAPEGTMLSIPITVTRNSSLYALDDRLCATSTERTQCVPLRCDAIPSTLVNLSGQDIVEEHEYLCTVQGAQALNITCQG